MTVEQHTSAENLLKAAGQLSSPEFDKFVTGILRLRAKRQVHCLSHPEDELLLKINQGLEPALQARYDELLVKRRSGASLTSEEYKELLRLTDLGEEVDARRAGYLAELARYKKISITELIENIGIPSDFLEPGNRIW